MNHPPLQNCFCPEAEFLRPFPRKTAEKNKIALFISTPATADSLKIAFNRVKIDNT